MGTATAGSEIKMMIRGVIFDIDGTLLDSNDAHAEAFQRAFMEEGHSFDFHAIRRLIGKGGDHLFPELVGATEDSPLGKKVSLRKKELFLGIYMANLRPFPQAKELVRAIHDLGLRIAVATSAAEDEVKRYLSIIGIEDWVETHTSASEVDHSKPDPDLIQVALKRLDLSPAETVMIGDTPYDIQAASRANVKTLALLSGGWKIENLKGAAAVYADPADLLAHLDSALRHLDKRSTS